MLKKFSVILLSGPIRVYQALLSPFFGRQCRFQPTCSAYAREALHHHGPWRGLVLTFNRLRRCHPVKALGADHGFTFDPVPSDPVKKP